MQSLSFIPKEEKKAPKASSRLLLGSSESSKIFRTSFNPTFFSKKVLLEKISETTPPEAKFKDYPKSSLLLLMQISKEASYLCKEFFLENRVNCCNIFMNSFHGQLSQYYALQLAKILFPKNFPKAVALRFSGSNEESFAHLYFIPPQSLQLGKQEDSPKSLRPKPNSEAQKIRKAGIMVSASSILCREEGSFVFHEVDGVVLSKLLPAIQKLPEGQKAKAKLYLSLLLASYIDHAVSLFVHEIRPRRIREFSQDPLEFDRELKHLVENVFCKGEALRLMLDFALGKAHASRENKDAIFGAIRDSDYLKGGAWEFLRNQLASPLYISHLMKEREIFLSKQGGKSGA
ncbi:MAG: hypothetical protein N3F07_03600 [Candidatus Micrarchaeota archaeon]|nr:hypothetical protein [Candidatus Micrarchaeota archaeon]